MHALKHPVDFLYRVVKPYCPQPSNTKHDAYNAPHRPFPISMSTSRTHDSNTGYRRRTMHDQEWPRINRGSFTDSLFPPSPQRYTKNLRNTYTTVSPEATTPSLPFPQPPLPVLSVRRRRHIMAAFRSGRDFWFDRVTAGALTTATDHNAFGGFIFFFL